MKRRTILKGAAAAAVCPFACSKPDTPAQAEELESQHDGAEAPETGHAPDTYVEFGARQSGKTTRLMNAVTDWTRVGPNNIALVLSPTLTSYSMNLHILETCRADPPNHLPFPFRQVHVFQHHADGRGRTALAQWSEWMEKQLAEGTLEDKNVRVFFDEWDFMNPQPGMLSPDFVPYLKGAYYTTTLRGRRSARSVTGELYDPTFRRLMENARRVHLYQDLDGSRFAATCGLATESAVRREGGQVFLEGCRPTPDCPLPRARVYRPRIDPGTGLPANMWDFEQAYYSNSLRNH